MTKNVLFGAALLGVSLFFHGCTLFSEPIGNAETFSVNNVYGSHMVLQRQKPIQIVGSAEAGKCVKVAIGENSVVAKADEQGIWKAVLPAMEAGGPYSVTVSGAEGVAPVVFEDVLIGEVWFCSGQSNMQMPVVGGRFWGSRNGKEEAAAANFPQIRIFQVHRVTSPGKESRELINPKEPRKWEICTPRSIGKFSACGFYFGRQLYKELGVPIGLVNSSWGGTRIEPWISRDAFENSSCTEEFDLIKLAEAPDFEEQIAERQRQYQKKLNEWVELFYSFGNEAAGSWKNCDYDDSGWNSVSVETRFPEIGVEWFRKTVELPESWAGKEVTLNLGAVDDLDETYFNGVKVGSISVDNPIYWKANRSYKIPAGTVKSGSNTIAVRVGNIAGAGGFVTTDKLFVQCGSEKIAIGGNWKHKKEFTADPVKLGERPRLKAVDRDSPQFPTNLYNSMVKPWTVYPMRGFIWYQGCSNAGEAKNSQDARNYMALHPLLIQGWRDAWNDQNMPFILTQLAGYQYGSPYKPFTEEYLRSIPPKKDRFAEIREVQGAMLNMPLTGMASAIDIGDHSDIHPANKQDLAYRLAQEAKRLAYGSKGITSGPMFKSMKVEGNKIRIEYTNVGSGLEVRNGKLGSFAIAGKDGKFVWANAELDGNTVVVWADSVSEPVHVRYAWAGFPLDTNLYNKEGFPACPFRTDAPDYLLK